jgi:hypothetical protein
MIDRLIVSADDETYFIQYANIVYEAWKKFFPKIKISLALVTDKEETDSNINLLKKTYDVSLFKKIDGIPIANQAKMARHFLSTQFENEVVSIEDMDTIPLQRDFFEDKFNKREKDTILLVGSEVYDNTPHEGKCPISTITSESYNFKKVYNPDNLNYEEFIQSFIGYKKFDKKEDISKIDFSDESLLRALIDTSNINKTVLERGINIGEDWIDRSWWMIDTAKLKNEQYVTCNFLRPFIANYGAILPVVNFIYGKNLPLRKVVFTLKG